MIANAPTYRWTVEEWRKLGEAAIFDQEDRVELLNGEIIIMSPIGYRHSLAVNKLNKFFVLRAQDRYLVSPQNPVVLDDISEPQPDVVLIAPEWETHATDNPRPAEVLLLIEVADSSLPYDRAEKLRAYAQRNIMEFWIVNLRDDVIETFREPAGDRYGKIAIFARGQSVTPVAFPDLTVPVNVVVPA